MNVLLVCDNPNVAVQVMSALVGEENLDILEVRTPQRALALLEEGRSFDIVVADADTTPTGGMYLSHEIKAREKMGQDMPPVLLLIAREQDHWLSKWSEADACVLKPADAFDLGTVVHALAEDESVPALPGVWAEPTPGLLKMPHPPSVGDEGGAGDADDRA